MRIAFIVEQFPTLSETFILNQITGLIDRGHEVDIYANRPGSSSKTHADVEKYCLQERTYYRATPGQKLKRFIQGFELVATNFHKHPRAIVEALNLLKYGRDVASLKMLYIIACFLNRGPYDIVHCHFGGNGNLGIFLRRLGAISGKIVTTFHGSDLSDYLEKQGVDLYKSLFEQGDLLCPISEHWKKKLIELGCSEQKIIVHRMGIDTCKFNFSARKLRENGKIKLLSIARLTEKKGIKYGIQAVTQLLEKHPSIEYKIVGEGPLRCDLEKLIEELNVTTQVKLLGWKQQEEIVELIQDSDILLAPSVTSDAGDQEGIPVVLMEALAKGLPVLSTQHSGIPELVQDGKSGFLVPERDVDALAQKLEYLIENSQLWSEMGHAGRKHVEDHYDIHQLNDQLVELYQKISHEILQKSTSGFMIAKTSQPCKDSDQKLSLLQLIRRILRPLNKGLYYSDFYTYVLYPAIISFLLKLQKLAKPKQFPVVISDLKTLAVERGWFFKTHCPTTIQQCEASKTITEESSDIVMNGKQRVAQAFESRLKHSRSRGEMYYSHLYATTRYPVYETFTCEIPGAVLLNPDGLVVTPQAEILAQSSHGAVTRAKPPVLPAPGTQRLASTYVSLLTMYSANSNYAHWLMDSLPRLAMVDLSDPELKIIIPAQAKSYLRESLSLLGLSEERLLEMNQESLAVEKLILCHAAQRSGIPSPVHLLNIRDRLTTAATGHHWNETPTRRLYVSRSRSSRRIVNETELLPILKAYDFEVVFCEDLSFGEQISLFTEATVVLGAHGAGIFNHIFCNPGSVVIEIFNRERWEHAPRRIAGLMNHQHWHIFGEQVGEQWDTWVEPKKLEKVLSYALETNFPKEKAIHDQRY